MMKSLKLKMAAALCVAGIGIVTITAERAVKTADAIWAEDRLFGTVATPTRFRTPPEHSTDVIFSFAESGLTGQRSVAEAAPGNPAYNGGRWHVYGVEFTEAGVMMFDEDMNGMVDEEFTNAEAVLEAAEAGLVVISDAEFYFECPLLPSKK
jgi:hypothetical protein